MPPSLARKSTKEMKESILSVEYGETTARGRPARKSAGKRTIDPSFVDSATAIKDKFADFIEEQREEALKTKSKEKRNQIQKALKRVRSPSPPPYEPVELVNEKLLQEMEYSSSPLDGNKPNFAPINISINIPLGFSGPVNLHLDPETITKLSRASPILPSPSKRQRISYEEGQNNDAKSSNLPVYTPRIQRYVDKHGKPPAGFCDLPAELRNTIYKKLFVANHAIDFNSSNINCQFSAAFLRTCRMVHEEGTSMLYQQNHFKFSRNKTARNPFWSSENKEVGYLDFRHFLTMIGPQGRDKLRMLSISFEDPAVPRHYYLTRPVRDDSQPTSFGEDGNLLAALKLLQGLKLYQLRLWFGGKAKSYNKEFRFLDHLSRIQADEITLNGHNKLDYNIKSMLWGQMTRQDGQKLYPERQEADRKRKLKANGGIDDPWNW